MILNNKNITYSQKGVDSIDKLDRDKALLYRSPSRIKFMGYTGDATRISESSTITNYREELFEMKAQISLGSTGTGKNKLYKNIHIYSRNAEYLDAIERIAYLYQDGDILKVCEYKKGTRGSRYSALFHILREKLISNKFKKEDDYFIIDSSNIDKFVKIVNEICDERENEQYYLIKNSGIDELKSGIFNRAYWTAENDVQDDEIEGETDIKEYKKKVINFIDECNEMEKLQEIQDDIETIYNFCKSKIEVVNLLK